MWRTGGGPVSGPGEVTTEGRRGPAVLGAAALLVVATWGALALADDSASADAAEAAPTITLPTALPGFLADAWFLPDDGTLGFIEIPGGPFTMGSDPGVDSLAFDVEWWGEGRVQGTVDVPAFHLNRFEVTTAQFAAFLVASGHTLVSPQTLSGPPDHPVAWVAWTDAVAYARWLDAALRSSPSTPESVASLLSDGWTVALPTEDQWEKAARGEDARIYPWGDGPRPDRAQYGRGSTAPVGSFPCPECPYALSDMSGNVWEWTRSPYQPYPYTTVDDRADLGAEALWVMRGGSFQDTPQFIRAANRGGADPGARRSFIGFRVALVQY